MNSPLASKNSGNHWDSPSSEIMPSRSPGTAETHRRSPCRPRQSALIRRRTAIRPIEVDTPAMSPLERKSPTPRFNDTAPAKAGTSAKTHHHGFTKNDATQRDAPVRLIRTRTRSTRLCVPFATSERPCFLRLCRPVSNVPLDLITWGD